MGSPGGSSVLFRRSPASLRKRIIERFARTLETEVAKGRAFECLVTGDAELQRLNHRFRGKDQPTDVLSFPAAEPDSTLGSIAISLRRAATQAREFGHSTEDEVRILMLHGVLHLMGMDHESDAGRMARAEKRWRAKLGLPTGLIARTQARVQS
jgi:probable rRNA maturation factor